MQPRTPKLLSDILASTEFVLGLVAGKDLDVYRGDPVLRAAAERHLEIIGEAVNRLAREDPGMAARIPGYRQVVSFRNVLIHGYDLVDHGEVWRVITGDLPALRDTARRLLGE